jgi:hypothetical protein
MRARCDPSSFAKFSCIAIATARMQQASIMYTGTPGRERASQIQPLGPRLQTNRWGSRVVLGPASGAVQPPGQISGRPPRGALSGPVFELPTGVSIGATGDDTGQSGTDAILSELVALGSDATKTPKPEPGRRPPQVRVQVAHRPDSPQGEGRLAADKAHAASRWNANKRQVRGLPPPRSCRAFRAPTPAQLPATSTARYSSAANSRVSSSVWMAGPPMFSRVTIRTTLGRSGPAVKSRTGISRSASVECDRYIQTPDGCRAPPGRGGCFRAFADLRR